MCYDIIVKILSSQLHGNHPNRVYDIKMNETIAALDTNTLILILLLLIVLCLIGMISLAFANRSLRREVNAASRAYVNMGKESNSLIDLRLQDNGSRVDSRLMFKYFELPTI